MKKFFFTASVNAWRQLTDLFDVTWPAVAGLWNLRWQVNGFVQACPSASQTDLANRFLYGSGIERVNFNRSFFEHSWEKQQSYFARIILGNCCAIFEGYLKDLNISSFQGQLCEKKLQYPSINGRSGVLEELSRLLTVESIPLRNAFFNIYSQRKYVSSHEINNMIICYRYFKECRNAYMHNNNKATQYLLDAQAGYKAILPLLILG